MNSEPKTSIAGILGRSLDFLQSLLDHLEEEARALDSRDSALIEAIADKKHATIDKLNQVIKQQNDFLSALKFPAGNKGLEAYFGNLKKHRQTTTSLRETLTNINRITVKCKHLNETNGARITLMQRHVRRSIEVLQGQRGNTGTYGPDGTNHRENITTAAISI